MINVAFLFYFENSLSHHILGAAVAAIRSSRSVAPSVEINLLTSQSIIDV